MAKSAREYAEEFANMDVDYQGILDRFNTATEAGLSRKRAQLAQTENKFYNQMYDTQRTALDTIRQSNARAVSTGASRGMQAANELSAILGLQEQSVETASQLAQASQDLAAEESEAVLNNVLKAYQQAKQEQQTNYQLGLQMSESEFSREKYAQEKIAQAEAQKLAQIQRYEDQRIQARKDGDATTVTEATKQLMILRDSLDMGTMTKDQMLQNRDDFNYAIDTILHSDKVNFKGTRGETLMNVVQDFQQLADTAGFTKEEFNAQEFAEALRIVYQSNYGAGPEAKLAAVNAYASTLFNSMYTAKYNAMHRDDQIQNVTVGQGWRAGNIAYKERSEREQADVLAGQVAIYENALDYYMEQEKKAKARGDREAVKQITKYMTDLMTILSQKRNEYPDKQLNN